jgi:agmatine deiminase
MEAARRAYAAVAQAVSAFEPVTMLVRPEQAAAARTLLGPAITLLPMSLDDSWARDFCPTFLQGSDGQVAGADWRFNCWGENFPDYAADALVAERVLHHLGMRRFAAGFVLEGGAIHVDGEGTILTTEECLLNPNRNPDLDRTEIEAALKEWLGGTQVIWLGEGYEQDDTSGHIDEIACFAAPGKVLVLDCDDPADVNYARFKDNIRRLELSRDAAGRTPEIIRLPQPRRREVNGTRLTLSYTNFYIANGGVVMSAFDDPADAVAREIIARCFPDRTIVQLPALDITRGGGGIHCITQQQVLGEIAR